MIKTILSRVMWIGRVAVFSVGLAVTLALILGIATTALAGVPGDPFRLGQINTINRISQLLGSTDSAMLRVDNNSTGANATALQLQVESGRPPMKVNSGAKVANLNADTLDGNTADAFYYYGEKVQDSEFLDGLDSIEFYTQRTRTYIQASSVSGRGGGREVQGTAVCDAGDKRSGGGAAGGESGDYITSFPHGFAQGWALQGTDNGLENHFIVYAVCVDFAPFRP